jgi:acetyltransferase-like isoleucine patch superfamily enzyme
MKGEIIINNPSIYTGMIHIGPKIYGFQTKHDYTIWEQFGGKVIFEPQVRIGKGTFISIGKNAELKLENGVHFGGNDRLICYSSVSIGKDTRVAWNVQIIDTDFRSTINTVTKTKNSQTKPIIIGQKNWLCFGSIISKGSVTPDSCIVSSNTTISKDYSEDGNNIIIGNENNAKVLCKYITFEI